MFFSYSQLKFFFIFFFLASTYAVNEHEELNLELTLAIPGSYMQNQQPKDTIIKSNENQLNQNMEANSSKTHKPSINQKRKLVRYNPAIHGPDKKLFDKIRKHESDRKYKDRNQNDPIKRERFLKMRSENSKIYRFKRNQDPQRAQKEKDRQRKSKKLLRELKRQQQQQDKQE